jgi:hypothetical protein
MFSQPYRSSTEEESSDAESAPDVASKTTSTDSWYDVKSDNEQPQQIKQSEEIKSTNVNEQIVDDDDDDEDEDDDTEDSDDDLGLIKSINEIYINGSTKKEVEDVTTSENDSRDISLQDKPEQQIQKEWTNPYWGAQKEPVTIVTQTIVKESKDTSDNQP